ncbi:MAG TPA: phosphopantothenoylcysteine decarboxylase, partial [Sphingobacterium sp.]|nr:phosphopantothenoylcysteine decarboxylase [Sphingobacterium sp.]
VDRRTVRSAQEMFNVCRVEFEKADIVVMSAAVADYTPVEVADQKIKKQEGGLTIVLKKTIDILGTLGRQKRADQTLVGFALETNNELEHAQDKLKRKNADFIVLNSMQDEGAGFATDTNKVTILHRDGTVLPYELKSKEAVAKDICQLIVEHQQLS